MTERGKGYGDDSKWVYIHSNEATTIRIRMRIESFDYDGNGGECGLESLSIHYFKNYSIDK